jgi:hypothetical protein
MMGSILIARANKCLQVVYSSNNFESFSYLFKTDFWKTQNSDCPENKMSAAIQAADLEIASAHLGRRNEKVGTQSKNHCGNWPPPADRLACIGSLLCKIKPLIASINIFDFLLLAALAKLFTRPIPFTAPELKNVWQSFCAIRWCLSACPRPWPFWRNPPRRRTRTLKATASPGWNSKSPTPKVPPTTPGCS